MGERPKRHDTQNKINPETSVTVTSLSPQVGNLSSLFLVSLAGGFSRFDLPGQISCYPA
jgi:hypothetical protein